MDTGHAQSERECSAVDFLSPWMTFSEPGESAHANFQHELFRQMVFGLLSSHCPWLLCVLEKAGGQILAGKGAFYIAIPWGSADWIEVPELSAWLHLVPWCEEGEQPQ
jgi:hypothetical protein